VRTHLVSCLVVSAILAGPARGQFGAFLVEETGGSQHNPDASGTVVVWNEFIDGDFLVRGKDLATGGTLTIDGPNVGEMDPVTDGHLVVWRDDRAGNFDVFAWDIQAGREWAVIDEPHNQGEHALDGHLVVWRDSRHSPSGVPPEFGNLDIYAADLRTGEEFVVCDASWNQQNPAVSGDIIVWQDCRRANPVFKPLTSDIYGYDVTTGREFLIASAADDVRQVKPDISGNIVVWSDMHNGGDIWGKNLSTGETFPICEHPSGQGDPAIDGRYVVWEDGRNATNDNNFDIYGYDLLTGREFPICLDPGQQGDPRISGNLVVWESIAPGGLDRVWAAYIPEPACAVWLLAAGAALVGRRRSPAPPGR